MKRLLCLLLKHKWRRPHKGEDQSLRYCTRCPASRTVRKRKEPVVQTEGHEHGVAGKPTHARDAGSTPAGLR